MFFFWLNLFNCYYSVNLKLNYISMSILEWFKLFDFLTTEEKNKLSLFCQERVLNKWEKLFNQWDEWNSMYLLNEWIIEVVKEKEWENIHLWEVLAEEIIGEMAIFWENKKRMATAIAVEKCHLIVILSFSIKELTEKYPKIMEKIQKIIIQRQNKNSALEK